MITKTRLFIMTMIIASLTFGIAAVTTNTLMTQHASAQRYAPPPDGSAGSGSPENSTSGNSTK
ncbi:MAG TPA: hypothetical protein VH796_03310 [Nitrososphaeraceae archaeon]|jgi:hypothetical protein